MSLEEFNQVLLPFGSKMYRFAVSLLSDRIKAEDLVQDVYLNLWKKRKELNDIENLEAYAMRAVKNTALNILKKREVAWENLDKASEVEHSIRPDMILDFEDTESLILRLIETLPPRQKTIFRLREFEHFRLEEIAEILDTDLNNVSVNLSISRKRIKELYIKAMDYEKRKTGSTS